MAEASLIAAGQERTRECSDRNHHGRSEPFNEFDCGAWRDYMKTATRDGTDWSVLARHHERYAVEVRRDLEPA